MVISCWLLVVSNQLLVASDWIEEQAVLKSAACFVLWFLLANIKHYN